MLATSHSRTAEATAAIRACHLRYDAPVLFEDPFALALTSPLWRTVCRYPWLYWPVVRGLLRGLRPVHGWILARDHLTEETLRAFAGAGHSQFVLLGAGFDSTGLRNPPWLADVRVIEVDHPATQAVKLERIRDLVPAVDQLIEAVAIDFEHEDLEAGLARSAYDRGSPALFAWQGVIYYLTEAAIRGTLGAIGRLTAPGSELMFDFLLPEHSLVAREARALSLARLMTTRMGERYISFHTPDAVTALLDEAGFDVIEIMLDRDFDQRYFAARTDGLCAMRGFGIAHARRR